MANAENLKGHGFNEMTAKKQREIASMGGKASQKKRQEKATMRAVLEAMLNEVPTNNNPQGLTYRQMATLGLIKGAVKGNSMNYKTIIETMGEDKTDTNSSNGVIDNLIEALNNVRK